MSIPALFTPAAVPPTELDAMTVGRADLLETLTNRISSSARDGSRPHTLLVGPHGAGKTHILHVVLHRALATAATSRSVLPVRIAEDSLAIASYTDLLVEIARAIGPELGEQARALRRARDPVGIEAAVIEEAAGRTILLTIENLDRVFDGLGTAGQGSLRAWVETSTAILILATAPALFPGISSREFPWYGSFMVETIPDLGVDDVVTLLTRSAQRRGDADLVAFLGSAAGRDRITVIHRLAGGAPRTWRVLSECVDVGCLDALTPAVEALLDRLAPYYQQRLWQLAPGEQRLVVELARGPGPRTVSDLADAVGVSNQSASAALGRLAADRWVSSSKAGEDRRTSWYDLTEPLFRDYLRYRGG
ncbi:MAG: MarR family transcriptional regulator [Mycobacterium sp.]